jgi:hypothetical protein
MIFSLIHIGGIMRKYTNEPLWVFLRKINQDARREIQKYEISYRLHIKPSDPLL